VYCKESLGSFAATPLAALTIGLIPGNAIAADVSAANAGLIPPDLLLIYDYPASLIRSEF
jgi:hypothetical protein